ncbi:hypothetical protein [Consotaella aegiceratis]|uniref:hypothetical protein n=1 Tax=Consotaella aegiceratis TaxID=3097961 RepID=UPI002F3F1F1D
MSVNLKFDARKILMDTEEPANVSRRKRAGGDPAGGGPVLAARLEQSAVFG